MPKNVPQKVLDEAGAKYFGEVQPRYTHIIDLEEDLTAMKSRMSKTNRNLINRSEKIGIKYSESTDVNVLIISACKSNESFVSFCGVKISQKIEIVKNTRKVLFLG